MTGLFFVLEGPDGSGQDTQALKLQAWLEERGYKVLLTREPTDSHVGQEIREILRGEKPSPGAAEIQELMIEDRKLHQQEIKQNCADGVMVVCVRYFYSTLAYGEADGLDMQILLEKNRSFLKPDLAIYLDINPSIALERIKSRGTRLELFEKEEFLSKVRKNFLYMESKFYNFEVVDGSGSIEEVHQQVIRTIKRKFDFRFK